MSPVFRHGRLRLYLLKLLDESPRHGYEVIRLLQDRFMGVYAPSPGTIYPRLARLEEDGLVTHEEVDGKKVYSITDKGREEIPPQLGDLADLEDELTESLRDVAREISVDVRDTVRSIREELASAAREFRSQHADKPAETARPTSPSPRTAGPATRRAGSGRKPAGPRANAGRVPGQRRPGLAGGGVVRHRGAAGPRPPARAASRARARSATWSGWRSSSPPSCAPPPSRRATWANDPSVTCGTCSLTRWPRCGMEVFAERKDDKPADGPGEPGSK